LLQYTAMLVGLYFSVLSFTPIWNPDTNLKSNITFQPFGSSKNIFKKIR